MPSVRRRHPFALTRRILLVTALNLFFLAGTRQAHAEEAIPDTFILKQRVPIKRCNMDGTEHTPSEKVLAPGSSAYNIIGSSGDAIVIDFLPWDPESHNFKKYNVEHDANGKPIAVKLWCITKADQELRSKPRYQRTFEVGVGLLVVPIKLRTGMGKQKLAFTTDVGLGTALDLSVSLRRPEFRLHFPIFAGLSSVEIRKKESTVSDDRTAPAFSFGAGLGFSGQGAGAGIIVGWDIINDNDEIKWKRQARAWLGFSVGTTFGVSARPAPASDPKKQPSS